MSERSPANVSAAYELLLEELASEIDWVNKVGGKAFTAGDHARAAKMLAQAQALEAVRADLHTLGQRLQRLVEPREATPPMRGRVAKGLKTPEDAYRVPLLRALVERGGSADLNAVLERVHAAMKECLNEHDLAPLPSDPSCPRWRNTAQWCRNTMRIEGLIKDGSPHGQWEISPMGRAWLDAHDEEG